MSEITAFRVTARTADDAWLLKALAEVKADLTRQGDSAVGRLAIASQKPITVIHDVTCDACDRQEGIEVWTEEVPAPYNHVWTYVRGTLVAVVQVDLTQICTACVASWN